jgi:hypothetical protein
VLGTEHVDCAPFGQRGTNGIGATLKLVPAGTGVQRHLLRTAQEVRIAVALQHHAPGVSQNDHAVGVADLLEEVLKHRLGMWEIRVRFRSLASVTPRTLGSTFDTGRVQARLTATLPGAQYVLVEQGFRSSPRPKYRDRAS